MAFTKGKSGNPSGRPRKDVAERMPKGMQRDTWENVLSGLGRTTHDKRMATMFSADVIGDAQAQQLWRGDDLAARIVETVPREMTRTGFEITIKGDDGRGDKAQSESVGAFFDELCAEDKFFRALCYREAYGGGAIFLGANDGRDASEPLIFDAITACEWLTVLEPRELVPFNYYANPLAPKYGEIYQYQLAPIFGGASKDPKNPLPPRLIHESRLLLFPGKRVSRDTVSPNGLGWGDSVFTRVLRTLTDFSQAWASTGILMADFAQAVFKMDGLADAFANDKGALILERMQAFELARSTARMAMIDKEEEFGRHQTPMSGLPEVLNLYEKRLAAACDIPRMILFSDSPGGMNGSGSADAQTRHWYDQIAGRRARELTGAIETLARVAFRCLGIEEPAAWSVKFLPLWQETPKEQAETRKLVADTDAANIANGVVSAEEVRNSRFGGDEYSTETQIDSDDLNVKTETVEFDPVTGAPLDPDAAALAPDATSAPGSKPAAGTEPAKAAMTGVQVTSLIEVVKAAVNKEIPRESAAAILALAYPLSPEEATALLGPEHFKAAPPEPKTIAVGPDGKPAAFGGGAPPFGKSPDKEAPKPGGAASPFPPGNGDA